MSINGPAPKDPSERIRRNLPTFDTDTVEWDGVLRGPTLPKDTDWTEATKKWWLTWRKSPQSMVMVDTDWQFMLTTAMIHNKLHKGELSNTAFAQLSAELRQREVQFGATYEARKKLRLDVITPDGQNKGELDDPVAAVQQVDYRKRLGIS